MKIAIRKEPNGSIYIDKEIYSKTQKIQDENGNIEIVPVFTDEELAQPPYNYTKIKIDDIYADCQASDFDEDLTFNLEKYNARKQVIANEEYENKIVELIRKKYNVNQELAILRQRDTKPEEFAEYNEYVEQCKEQVKSLDIVDKVDCEENADVIEEISNTEANV